MSALSFPTTSEAQASAAEETIVSEEFFARRPNPAYGESAGKEPAKRGRGKKFKLDPEALSLYDGYDGLLVRTALIRPPGYGKTGELVVSSESDVERLLAHLKYADQEHLVVMALNNANRVHALYEVAIGTSTGVNVQVRDIVKILILTGSVGLIIAHNHPSGNPEPSQDDKTMTESTQRAIGCLGYKLLDHVIIAANGRTSFYQKGWL